jgi:hypothetical protein
MQFDPAIAAQQALHRAEEHGELGALQQAIVDAEAAFSTDEGEAASQAYERLQEWGGQLPAAQYFQEFLIYITWQQVTAETIPRHFRKGADLCNEFIQRFGSTLEGSTTLSQVLDIQESFRGGLGEQDHTLPEYDEDAFQGGD